MRVAIDGRRQRDNGVARVTRLLVASLEAAPLDVVVIGPEAQLTAQFPWAEIHDYTADLLSVEDFTGLGSYLDRRGIDCLVAPQFYVSPHTSCPQVRILHDAIPFAHAARLPTREDVANQYSERTYRDLSRILANDRGDGVMEPREMYRRFYELAISSAAVLFTVSTQSKRDLRSTFGISASEISLLDLYADSDVVEVPAKAVRERRIDCLHVSKFEPRKNQLELMEAWRRIHERNANFRACIVGAPSTLYPEYGRRLLREISRGVEAGWLEAYTLAPDGLLAELYGHSRIVCIPSTFEGFGLPSLEGMANGCVVVGNAETAVGEVCGEHLVSTTGDADDLVAVLEGLMGDVRTLEALASGGRERAGEFTQARTRAVLVDGIYRAVGSTPTRG